MGFEPRCNTAPGDFDPLRDLPAGFYEQLVALHGEFSPRQRALAARRAQGMVAAQLGALPTHFPPSEAVTGDWRIALPSWCADQRNQMTGPADDGELVVKMLNSGAPGVMIDLEDSMANDWATLMRGHANAVAALHGTLNYHDTKRNTLVAIAPSSTVTWVRVRGLHLHQAGVVPGDLVSASLFDVALLVHRLDPARMRHPIAIYIPKSESAEEALWWRDLFARLGELKGLPRDHIKCMALVESHPLAYAMEEFLYHLRDHILGLNLGRWDYMASLIHFNLADPAWVLPDRNTIPHDVPFFQRLRELLPEICHKRGALAIGGMTALFPSRTDAELNARALTALERDKQNEAAALMDGAWTGHPDQNAIAVAQFPDPNQGFRRPAGIDRYPDLRPAPAGVGAHTVAGSRAAARVTIRYRAGVLAGRGASLIEGYMEDLATDRIYRLMLAQRVRHRDAVAVLDDAGQPAPHTPEFLTALYDAELAALLDGVNDSAERERYREARHQSEAMIVTDRHDPI
ncbi:MAG: aldolase/citrate lyase/malate synthase family protein [Gemmatimonadales bacterium]